MALLVRIARWIAGSGLILLGLVLSVPGIPGPGILIVLVGVLVLMPESRWLRKRYVQLRRKYPRVFSPIELYRKRRRRRIRPTTDESGA